VILGIARQIFGLVALGILVYLVWASRESLLEITRSGDPLQLSAAVVAWSLMNLMSPALSAVIFRGRGHSLSYQTALDIHISNLPARYLPGGIWHTVGRIAGFKRLGIARRDITLFVLLENALALGVAFLFGGIVVAWYHDMEGWGLAAACAGAGGLALLVALPFILSYRIPKNGVRLRTRAYVSGIGVVALSWFVGAVAFVLYVTAFTELDVGAPLVEIAGIYLFSWGAGFVSVFAPQGIGVFEVIAGELLDSTESLKGTVALLAGFRLVILLADSLTWAIQKSLHGAYRLSREVGS
jgi:glycosyltransferase 2 family protein